MSHMPVSILAAFALTAGLITAPSTRAQEADHESRGTPTAATEETQAAGDVSTAETGAQAVDSETELAKAADYMARRALEGHIAFEPEEIEAATGVNVEAIDEAVLQQAVLARLAELRAEMPDAVPAAQDDLVTLESFEQFVEEFNEYQNVPRLVLLLSPT